MHHESVFSNYGQGVNAHWVRKCPLGGRIISGKRKLPDLLYGIDSKTFHVVCLGRLVREIAVFFKI